MAETLPVWVKSWWRPMETAPIDGTCVLLSAGGTVFEGQYEPDANGWWLANTDPSDYHDGQVFPEAWMPMPPPADSSPQDDKP